MKFTALDVPPPGAGFVTETGNVPAVATSASVRASVSWVLLTKLGVRLEPLKLTDEVLTKAVPLIVRVCAPEPAKTEVGEREVIVGTRFPTVKFTTFDVPPPGVGFVTETGNTPTVATSVLVRASVSWVLLTKVGVRLEPLKLTDEVLTKPVPLMVRVGAPEPVPKREVITGTGFTTVKFTALDVPPPGVGFVTETGNVPAVATSVLARASVSWVLLTKVGVRVELL
jgi:hypothetical protein